MADAPRTLFDKIWESHVVVEDPGSPTVLYIDLHLVHEVTSPQAFSGLRARGLRVRRPDRTVATAEQVEQLVTRPIENTIAQNAYIKPPSGSDYVVAAKGARSEDIGLDVVETSGHLENTC